MLARFSAAALLAAALATVGCCPTPAPQGRLLEPMLPSTHLAAINAKADLIETLRARGRVQIKWTDTKGNTHHETADGVLIIRQRLLGKDGEGETSQSTEVVLFGRVASQDVFELGENLTNYWMAVRVDPKTATVGTKASPLDDRPDPALPFRAGKVPEILGIAPLSSSDPSFVTTNPETVDVIVIRPSGSMGGGVDRILSFSRYGVGDLDTVRLYRTDGLIEGLAKLTDYREIPTAAPPDIDAGGRPTGRPGASVRLPFHIEINYPNRDAQVTLDIENYELGIPLKDLAFKMPDFAKQGLKVETTPH